MSKRFGRNQRRKMRAEIALLAMSHKSAVRIAAEHGREAEILRSRLRRWAEDVAQLMGRDSAFNERVRRMTVDDVQAYGGRLRLGSIDFVRPMSRVVDLPVTTVETIIEALIWRLHFSRDEYKPMVRIELENRAGEAVGYALPEEHFWTTRDIEYLGRQIADKMAALVNKGKGGVR